MLIFRYPWFIYSFLVPCYGSLKPGFSQLQRGHRLDRKLIQSFTELSFLDCVIECLVTPRCKSVNYFKGANFCEINYENKTTAETRYMESAGWVYSEKEHWPKVNVLESILTNIYTLSQDKIYIQHNFKWLFTIYIVCDNTVESFLCNLNFKTIIVICTFS